MSAESPPKEPPPLPPPLPLPKNTYSDIKSPQRQVDIHSPDFKYTDICKWATDRPQLWEVCGKYDLCLYRPPFKYNYKHFESIIQSGPTCGLVALSMLIGGEVSAEEMLNIAQLDGFSNNGEMFSCKAMMKLTEKVFSLAEIEGVYVELRQGDLFSNDTVEMLLQGAVLLVPYDADFNNAPCLKKGHKAHWALVSGVIVINKTDSYVSDPNNIHVICRQGKSRYLAAWPLSELDKSNANLYEFSPERDDTKLIYCLPEGGIGGSAGLRDQYLMFHGL